MSEAEREINHLKLDLYHYARIILNKEKLTAAKKKCMERELEKLEEWHDRKIYEQIHPPSNPRS